MKNIFLLPVRFLPVILVTLCFCAGPVIGQVLVWGDYNANPHLTNVPPSATNVIALAAGDYHCLALRADGTVVAWGYNNTGPANVPPDLTNVVSVAAGSTHSLALRSDGTVTMWGVFFGTSDNTVSPSATNVVALALGPGAQHALALRADGTVVDWGAGGNNYFGPNTIPPSASNIVSVAAGAYHSVALRSDGKVVAWGDNSFGELNVPAAATNIVAIAAGWFGNAALRADGTILTWGRGVYFGQQSDGFTNVIDVACTFNDEVSCFVLALRGDGSLVMTPWILPSPPANATNIVAIAAGSYDGLALIGSGPPIFPGIPAQRTVASCSTAYLRMNAVGAFPLFYQWSCNGTNIPGATNSVLALTNVQLYQAGNYAVVATNACGSTLSSNMMLTVLPVPPSITAQPANQTNSVGYSASLTVATTGSLPLSYQWNFNGTNINGATNATLMLANVQLSQAGNYAVLVTNAYGTVLSSNAVLAVVATPPAITTQPTNETIFVNDSVSFSVAATGSLPLSCQWNFNGTNIGGATNAMLTLTQVQLNQAGNYTVLVTNTFGAVLSSNAMLVVVAVPPAITTQPTNQNVFVGDTAVFVVASDGPLPLTYQWAFNGKNIVGATNATLTLTNVQFSQDGNYTVWVTNAFGSALSSNAMLMAANPSVPDSFNPGADGYVLCTAVQADGKILVGGSFQTLGGQGRSSIGRLNADGTLDTNFNPGVDFQVYSLAVQTDGKILVGGYFGKLGGQNCSYIGRLNADGTLDTNFNPGADNVVYSLAVQADGKIVVGGDFDSLGGLARWGVGRLNPDGTGDTNFFNPEADNEVYSLAVQADGKILVGGVFDSLGGLDCWGIGRLTTNGTLDTTFNPGGYNDVNTLAVQADGKILAGGWFSINRLNADGTLDTTFNSWANNTVNSLAVLANGKILVGGWFTTLDSQDCSYIGQLNADGTLDTTFNPGTSDYVLSLAVQADGKIVVGGNFDMLGDQSRSYIGRLTPSVPATQSLTFDGSTVSWQRGGSSPEVWRTTFDGSTNGTNWVALGDGTRLAGGWQLTGVAWPANAEVRARGFVTGGGFNSSGWFVEMTNCSPLILSQPTNQTVFMGSTAAISVGANGTAPLSYQWQFNGTNLAGATNYFLVLTNVQMSQAGTYSLTVGNAYGNTITSAVLAVQPFVFNSGLTNQLMTTIGLRLQLDGVYATNSVILYASTNLTDWLPILTNAPATGSVLFLDLSATNRPLCIYRATEQ